VRKLRRFVLTAALGGFFIILPVVILVRIAQWLYRLFIDSTGPLISFIEHRFDIPTLAAEWLTLAAVFAACFLLGMLVRTPVGGWLHARLDQYILTRIPGYKMIRDIIKQFGSEHKSLFREVVLVRVGDDGPEMTGFVVDQYDEDGVSVFVPTGPNPTTGLILHTRRQHLTSLNTTVEHAMKTILSCGAGTGALRHS
jgi:uncharacterized membrane protein